MFMYFTVTGAELAAARMNSQLYVDNIVRMNSSVIKPPSRHSSGGVAMPSIATGP